ncbi:nitrilase-related carbon-nitrogen hydrolase [Pseudoalteromonas rubra]|uniref:nitrilase-related carbon-nitrogen hydrolase n=1 Tax=Pseudoalteromonas rubra TaxID=43658 RepID=UPI0013DE58E9|nr:nitrilase-related carbon-nitrogen hydrolase [Pseudoalteromonas rubra]
MKIGFFQFDVAFAEPQQNRDAIRAALTSHEFDLMLLPELCTTGSIFFDRHQVSELAEDLYHGPSSQLLQTLAQEKSACIVAGLAECYEGQLYNSTLLAGPDGLLGVHRKVHLAPTDQSRFVPGKDFCVYEVQGVKIGVLLCYDIWFEDGLASLKEQGVQIILNPSNFCGEDSLAVIKKAAKDYGVYVIAANRLGMDHDCNTGVRFIGNSLIVDPQGKVLVQGDESQQLRVIELAF